MAGFVAGILQSNYELIANSLHDYVAEPYRAALIPGFTDLKKAAIESGTLGAGISGSGPSVFALCESGNTAMKVAESMKQIYLKTGIESDVYVSAVNPNGCIVL